MAFQMEYTDESDNTYPESYWRPVQINFSQYDQTAHVVFYGWKSHAARNNKKRHIGIKMYSCNPSNFDTYYAENVIKGVGASATVSAYQLAKDTLDCGTEETPVGFFNWALDV
jgi:hypothetical protein